MPTWIFLEKQADRSATGDAFRNSFEGEDVVATLARESIQNSVDAALEGATPVLRYTKKCGLRLRHVLSEEFWSHAGATGLLKGLERNNAEALYVEDFGTTGLTGSMHDLESNFYRLMGQLGGSPKEGGAGGSFGYGKAACILNSRCWTVLAYTITSSGSALFGTTYMDEHRLNGQGFTGLGWFCRDGSSAAHPEEVKDEEADRLARLLHIPRAETGEVGTSLMILFPSIHLDELKQAIERFWWPRLTDHALVVELLEGDVKKIPVPAKNRHVKSQVELYEVIQKKSAPSAGDHVRQISAHGRALGSLALRFIDLDERLEEDLLATAGTIALMRKQRMVIEYYKWSQGPRQDVIGVFVADPEINDDLRRCESLRHDVWSDKATRATEAQRQLARTVLERIRKEYRSFLNQYQPPASQDEVSLTEMRQFFGSLFGGKGKSGGGKKSEPIQIIDKVVRLEPGGEGLKLTGSATLTWKGKSSVSLAAGVRVELAESDVSTSGEQILTSVQVGPAENQGTPAQVLITLMPNQSVHILFESESYSADWTATATFFAEEVSA